MHTYSHLLEHPLALDAQVAIYGRDAAGDRHPHSAIHFYPARYTSRWKMRNGEEILLRPIRPEDEPLMIKFHEILSDQSVYLRYSHMENLSSRVAHERLIGKCSADFRQEMVLVADRTVPASGKHEILAVGRLSKMPHGQQAEIAVLVSDLYQRQGLGAELVQRLIEIAREEKLQEIVANILPENLAMRALADRFGFQLRPSKDPTTLTAVLNLARARAAANGKS
ncbi:MAG: GNAT family protein [Candidatus Acidiferrales bacterium]